MNRKSDPLQPERCAEILSALAAPERLRIVRLLLNGELNVTQLSEQTSIPLLNISHHLMALKRSNLICSKRNGRFMIYAITPETLNEVILAGVSKDALDLGCCQLVLPEVEDELRESNDPKQPLGSN